MISGKALVGEHHVRDTLAAGEPSHTRGPAGPRLLFDLHNVRLEVSQKATQRPRIPPGIAAPAGTAADWNRDDPHPTIVPEAGLLFSL